MKGKQVPLEKINFDQINSVALANAPAILSRWLPDGFLEGDEFTALNPKRSDSRKGSFKINIRTGKWADFATGDSGSDLIALAAYLFDLKQGEAARKLSSMLGISDT